MANERPSVIICESADVRGLTLNEYQQGALKTAVFPNDSSISYLALALCGEAGEIADKVKKVLRDKEGKFHTSDIHAVACELGDVLWYAACLAHALGYNFSDIGTLNIRKINSRIERGTLHGSGDTR